MTFGITAEETVQEIRHRIYLATRLTASAGIACNMRLAKLCSGKKIDEPNSIFLIGFIVDINKPNGQYQLESNINVILNFIRNLPIRKVQEKRK
jgi:DNA polymerase kappa